MGYDVSTCVCVGERGFILTVLEKKRARVNNMPTGVLLMRLNEDTEGL